MRYGNPSVRAGLEQLREDGVTDLLLAPLFPHFAQATTVSAVKEARRQLKKMAWAPTVRELGEFPLAPEYIDPLVASIRSRLGPQDHLLFSYHGLPVASNVRTDIPDESRKQCCSIPARPGEMGEMFDDALRMLQKTQNTSLRTARTLDFYREVQASASACYAHQCTMTTLAVVTVLGLADDMWSLSYQSRVGPAAWLEPATTDKVKELAQRGVKRLVIVSPAFLADGLETLEELEVEVRDLFIDAGGTQATVVPCLNDNADWVQGLEGLITKAFSQKESLES